MQSFDLPSLGWTDFFEGSRQQAARPELNPARVTTDHGSALRLLTPGGSLLARPHPDTCVGDWVLFAPPAGDERATIEVRLARQTTLYRQAPGRKTQRQAVACNLDVVFVVTATDPDFNPRRIERYLVAIRGGGAEPVIVLNKADLALGQHRRYLSQLPGDVAVVQTSAVLDMGIDDLRVHLGRGRTCGFVGSSGVGKSSLVRALLGDEVGAVAPVRGGDSKGQHTTTHRELYPLPDGNGILLDTPGMRELALWDGDGIGSVFADIEALADRCRFRDCGHGNEPGCAVLRAIEEGELEVRRLDNWTKLRAQAERQAIRKDAAALRKQGKHFAKVIKAGKRLNRR